jgi:putative holliday junction resolvase
VGVETPPVVVGLDVGTVRTGIARADSSETLATALTTVQTTPLGSLHQRILQTIAPAQVRLLVAGLPLDRNGGENEATAFVRSVCLRLELELGVDCKYQDERFSTREMHVRLKEAGKKQRARLTEIDAWAAMSILQAYLDMPR